MTGFNQYLSNQFPKKNVLTPIGWLATAVFSASVTGAILVKGSVLSWVLLAVGVIPVAVAIWAYIYFALRDPDRLQTEDYRIQKDVVAKLSSYHLYRDDQVPRPGSKLVEYRETVQKDG